VQNNYRYSTEPSAVTMIIGVAVTLLGLGLAIKSSSSVTHLDLTSAGALISAIGALALGFAQNGKVSRVLGAVDRPG
jgi:hypothetical protein